MKIQQSILSALLLVSTPMFALAANAPVAPAAVAAKPATANAEAGIAWFDGDVDAAFAYAKVHNKPLFLYWGATWCPPCNEVKATIFNRKDFIQRSSFFVPVHIDGDSPGAQKLGARFKVSGYPTTILFKADGTEITRLPGEVDAKRYLQTLGLAMNANHPVKDILKSALNGGKLSEDEWRMLAYYSWDTDEQQLVSNKDLQATLQKLAKASPAGDNAKRLALSALVAATNPKTGDPASVDKAAAIKLLSGVLTNPHAARDNVDLLSGYPTELVGLVTAVNTPARAQLSATWDKALSRLDADATLSKADRLSALAAKVSLARLEKPEGALSSTLQNEVRKQVAVVDKTTTDPFERHAVIDASADVLAKAGLLDDSDNLLKAELKTSHSPYYLMLGLAANAKTRGDKAAAISWYEQAYQAAQGPATRLQWGVTYLSNLIDLAPQDEARIEKVSSSVFQELGQTQNAFYERNRSSLEKLGRKLTAWKTTGHHDASFGRVQAQLNGVCSKLPAGDAQRATCQGLLTPAKV